MDAELDLLFEALARRAEQPPAETPLQLRRFVELAERWRIRTALREARGNRSAAARALGIGRRTLYTKLEKLGLAAHGAAAPDQAGSDLAASAMETRTVQAS